MKRLLDISLTERQLREIINALTFTRDIPIDTETTNFRGSLAKQLEREIWQPYHEEIARARTEVVVSVNRHARR